MALAELRRSTRAAVCLECGKCSTLCPLAASGTYSAARVAAIRDPGRELEGRAEAVERCLTCAACEVRCPQGVEFARFVLGLRHQLPEERRHPCPHGEALQAAARIDAAFEAPRRDHLWLDGDLRVAETGKVGLFVGCLALFDELFGEELAIRTVEIARAAVRLLNRLGIEPVVAADERCCGHDLLWNGERATFERLARANAEAFKARGVERLVTTCAECCRTWRIDYPEAAPGYRPRVQHLSELLWEARERGELEPDRPEPDPATYHDPCRLGRHLGVVEAPRRLLDGTVSGGLAEMERSRRDAVCCGSPGFVRCDADSRRLQSDRLRSAVATGASRLLTTCPKCWIHFTCAQREDLRRGREGTRIEVEDLTIFASRHLRATERPAAAAAAAPEQGEAP